MENPESLPTVTFDWSLIAMPVMSNPPTVAGKFVETIFYHFPNLERYCEQATEALKDLFYDEYQVFKKTQPDPTKRIDLIFPHTIPSAKLYIQTHCATIEDVAKIDLDKVKRSIEYEGEQKVSFLTNLRLVINLAKTAIEDFRNNTESDETKKVVKHDKI